MPPASEAAEPFLTTERLELWQPRVGEWRQWHEVLQDGEVTRHLGAAGSSESDSHMRFLRGGGSWFFYGYGMVFVRRKGEDAIIGQLGVFRTHRGFAPQHGFNDAPEAGWILARPAWGQGIAEEAMRAYLAWFDRAHGPQPIACLIAAGNASSRTLAERLGFVQFAEQEYEGEACVLLARG